MRKIVILLILLSFTFTSYGQELKFLSIGVDLDNVTWGFNKEYLEIIDYENEMSC